MSAEFVVPKNIDAAIRSLWPEADEEPVAFIHDDYVAVRNRLWSMFGPSAPFDRDA